LTVTVYTTPSCQQCTMTKRKLTRAGIPYESVDLTEEPATLEEFKALGFSAAPIVRAKATGGTVHVWSGFRPDLIDKLKNGEPLHEEGAA
jgi:glutaredoxin-like protein NrdH